MNQTTIQFTAQLENEIFIRTAGVAFLMPLNPTMAELTEIKTILAEAVVNAMIHGYENDPEQEIIVTIRYDETRKIVIEVKDHGVGIADVALARQPLYTTKAELERSGMGFTIMETFSDHVEVISALHQGTCVIIEKQLSKHE